MSTSVPSDTRATTAKELRRMRARKIAVRFGVGIGAPTLLAAVYFGAVVSPRFESVSAFTIQSAESGAPTNALQMLVSSVGSAGSDDLLVQQYILSRDMLKHLREHHHFVEHYRDAEQDVFTRLSADASADEQYDYYLERISVDHDTGSGVLTLSVEAYDPETAQALTEAILVESERMVNELSEHSRSDRMALTQSELERAEGRLARARAALRREQAESGHLSPLASAQAVQQIQSRLEGELAIARAEVSTVSATLPGNAPEMIAARRRVTALEHEIDLQGQRLAGGSEESLDDELATFEPLMIEKEFAQRAYESTLTSLELARVDAARQHRYLVRISQPSLGEDPSFPRFWYSLLTVLMICFAVVGVGTLVIASIREHANV